MREMQTECARGNFDSCARKPQATASIAERMGLSCGYLHPREPGWIPHAQPPQRPVRTAQGGSAPSWRSHHQKKFLCYSYVCMRVLFAILLLALAGLLWASFAAARHVRRVRKRRRNARPTLSVAPRTQREQPEVAPSGALSSGPAPRWRSVPPPPAPPAATWVNWDDLDGLDPLSEVTRSFSPVKKPEITVQQSAAASGGRADRTPRSKAVLLEKTPDRVSTADPTSGRSLLEATHSKALRGSRTHSLHAHG